MKNSDKLKAKGFNLSSGKEIHNGDNAVAFVDMFEITQEQLDKMALWLDEQNVIGDSYIRKAIPVLFEARKQRGQSKKPKKELKEFARESTLKYSMNAVNALEFLGEGDEDDFKLIETSSKGRLVFSEAHIFQALLASK